MNDKELLKDLEQLRRENKHLKEFYNTIADEVEGLDIPLMIEGVTDKEQELVRQLEVIKNLVAEFQI